MGEGALERWFRLRERATDVGTEVRAGVTTFMVMAYIIFVNPIVLGYVGVPGLDVEHTVPFRDKGRMKEVLEAAGIRVPVARRSTTVAGCWEAAEAIGYPLIVKPIAGAGSLDTYRLEDAAELEAALGRLGHIEEVSVEEFIDGEEFTYDTVSAAGRIAFDNICWYRPRPLVGKQFPRAKNVGGCGQRRAGQEMTARLHEMHAKSPA